MKALIVGSNSALAQAIVEELRMRSIDVVLIARRGQADYKFDASDVESIPLLMERILIEHPDLNAIIYTPAISINKVSHNLSIEDWKSVFDVNLFASTSFAAACIPHFIRKKGGVIQFISSSSAQSGQPGAAAYSASKAAMDNYVKTAAQEYSKYGLNIHSVCPGYFDGGLLKDLSEEKVGMIVKSIPANYLPKADEIAKLCCDLLTGSRYITGSNVVINGGKV